MSNANWRINLAVSSALAAAVLLGSQASIAMENETGHSDVSSRLAELEIRLADLEARGIPVTGIGRISRDSHADPDTARAPAYWDGFWERQSLEGN